MKPLITLEDHFLSKHAAPSAIYDTPMFSKVLKALKDLDHERLEDMDANNVGIQVISHAPATDEDPSAQECRLINDDLAEAIARHPTRYGGFAVLPMGDPDAAVAELQRCMSIKGFLGSLVDNHLVDGTFYDGLRFRKIFAAHQDLDVPIYLHPCYPSKELKDSIYGTQAEGDPLGDLQALMLGTAGWGWHMMTGLHILRLFAAGVFDEFPKLKVVIGHDGELLPFQMGRTLRSADRGAFGKHERSFKQVWDENIWITTSGMFSVDPMACILRNTKKDRIMFSVDYPFSINEMGVTFLKELKESGLVSEEELEMIGSENARKLLKLP